MIDLAKAPSGTTMVAMGLAALPAPAWPGVLGRWEVDPGVVVGVVIAAAVYEAGWRRSRRGRGDGRRRVAFLAGLATVVVALCSPVAAYAGELLSVHVIEHLLLTVVAAPLLVAGRPVAMGSAVLDPLRRLRLLRLRRHRLVGVLGHPLVAWLAFAAAGWAVHFSGLYEWSLDDPVAHAVEHVVLLGTALLFWRSVLGSPARGRLSHPQRLLYLAVAMPQEAFLGLVIFTTSSVLYPGYSATGRTWGPTPRADHRTAGAVLWTVTEVVLLVAVLWTASAWAGHERRMTARREALEDAASPVAGATGATG